MRGLLLLALVAFPSLVAAQPNEPEIPYFDVDAACARDNNAQGRRICVELEQSAYNRLKRVWPTASVSARNKALVNSASALKSKSYYEVLAMLLDTALRVEELQRPPPPAPTFQR